MSKRRFVRQGLSDPGPRRRMAEVGVSNYTTTPPPPNRFSVAYLPVFVHSGSLLGRLIPCIVMKQRNVPRSAWSIKTTKARTPYIVSPIPHFTPHPSRTTLRFIGIQGSPERGKASGLQYSPRRLTRRHGLLSREKAQAWNIGVDVVKIVLPRNIQIHTYIESLRRKVSSLWLTTKSKTR